MGPEEQQLPRKGGLSRQIRAGANSRMSNGRMSISPTRPVKNLPPDGKTTTGKAVLTDATVVAAIIAASIAAYRAGGPGPCACPSDVDRGGHSCGRRSAHDRAGGWTVYCSVADVSKEMIDAYRRAKGN